MSARPDTAPSLATVLFCVAIMGLGLWAAPDLALWMHSLRPAPEQEPIQTSARIGCELPSELETRLLYVNVKAGLVSVRCGPFVGGTGAYVK